MSTNELRDIADEVVAVRPAWDVGEVLTVLTRVLTQHPDAEMGRLRAAALDVAGSPGASTPWALVGSGGHWSRMVERPVLPPAMRAPAPSPVREVLDESGACEHGEPRGPSACGLCRHGGYRVPDGEPSTVLRDRPRAPGREEAYSRGATAARQALSGARAVREAEALAKAAHEREERRQRAEVARLIRDQARRMALDEEQAAERDLDPEILDAEVIEDSDDYDDPFDEPVEASRARLAGDW